MTKRNSPREKPRLRQIESVRCLPHLARACPVSVRNLNSGCQGIRYQVVRQREISTSFAVFYR